MSQKTVPLAQRIRGAWLGLIVGDALGAPYEFLPGSKLAALPDDLPMRAGSGWEVGEWTDDTALTLATAQAYADGDFAPSKAADAMVAWLATDPKDVGNTTRLVLNLIGSGRATYKTAGELFAASVPNGAANGSLMRALPTGIVRSLNDPRLESETRTLSRITHAAPRCVDACVSYNRTVAALLAGARVDEALENAGSSITDEEVRRTVERIASGKTPVYTDEGGIGFVLLALERALCALRDADDFRSGMMSVIRQGGDTDTNAAIAGGLLGARFGYDDIPAIWLEALVQRDGIEDALANLTKEYEVGGEV